MKDQKNFLVFFMLFLLFVGLIVVVIKPMSYSKIKATIKLEEAKEKLNDRSFFLIGIDTEATGTGWKIIDTHGADKKVYVKNIDLNRVLGSALKDKRNLFFVQGTLNENGIDQYGIGSSTELFIEEWHPIDPLYRDYSNQNLFESRFFYPKNYIDSFDVKKGDFNPSI